VSTVFEDDDEQDDDDTENDASQSPPSQISSTNNSILSTPTRSKRHKISFHQERVVDDENDSGAILSPPSRVVSPTSVSSPSSSAVLNLDGYDEPSSSPIEWYCDKSDELDYQDSNQFRSPLHFENDVDEHPLPPPPLLAPSCFTTTTPWMCVFDLDAACGGGDGYSSITSPNGRSSIGPQQHEHWNDLLPNVMDFSQWFTHVNRSNTSAPRDCHRMIHEQSSPCSPTEFDNDEKDHDDSKLLHLPLSPTSVRHPIMTLTTTTTTTTTAVNDLDVDDFPLISKQLFTNYATNCDIETIYCTQSPTLAPPHEQAMVCKCYSYGNDFPYTAVLFFVISCSMSCF
jgi:hypothetical protein